MDIREGGDEQLSSKRARRRSHRARMGRGKGWTLERAWTGSKRAQRSHRAGIRAIMGRERERMADIQGAKMSSQAAPYRLPAPLFSMMAQLLFRLPFRRCRCFRTFFACFVRVGGGGGGGGGEWRGEWRGGRGTGEEGRWVRKGLGRRRGRGKEGEGCQLLGATVVRCRVVLMAFESGDSGELVRRGRRRKAGRGEGRMAKHLL